MTGSSGLIRRLELSADSARLGGELGFRVELLPPALPLDLYLSVSYRDGRTEAIDLHAQSETAEMVWRVSPTAALGPAEFTCSRSAPA